MGASTAHARTARLLAVRLESVGLAAERKEAESREIALRLQLASAATRRAVRLKLLSEEEASSIWASAGGRYPALFSDENPSRRT